MSEQLVSVLINEKKHVVGSSEKWNTGHVVLFIDGIEVTQIPLRECQQSGQGEFNFNPHDSLLRSLPKVYKLSVKFPCETIVDCGEPSPLGSGDGSLAVKLESGYRVSSKGGYLFKPPSSSEAWRKNIFLAYEKSREAFADIPGVSDLFVAYGSLLGCVRAGDFISYDDDFDVAYIAEVKSVVEAADVFHRVVRYLKDKGYVVGYGSHIGNFHLKFPDLPAIDVFLMYYLEDSQVLSAFNIALECKPDVILPFKTAQLAGNSILIPHKAEVLLEATYGPHWKIPDPHFQWNASPQVKKLNQAYAFASMKVIVDDHVPVSEITYPTSNAVVNGPFQIVGTASDEIEVQRIMLAIFCKDKEEFWNGTDFQKEYARVAATESDDSWTYSFDPVLSGEYRVSSFAFNTSGNIQEGRGVVDFRVECA